MEVWYVAKVKPQRETCLMNFLSHRGVEVFFPRVIQPCRTGSRFQALFPTYLFFHLDPESSRWPIVRWAPGMSYILSQDGEPLCVPQDVVDYIQQRVGRWNDDATTDDGVVEDEDFCDREPLLAEVGACPERAEGAPRSEVVSRWVLVEASA